MDQFFAAVEVLDDPSLAGRPLLVAYDGRRGVVSTASYEARKFGCRSAQPTAVARRLCPHAVVIRPRHERYAEMSAKVFEVLEAVSPLVEPLSIDEAFLELTGTERLLGPAEETALRIKRRIRAELGLPCSAGLAPNKFLAKVATELGKPDGFVAIRAGDEVRTLAPLAIERLWGVGPKSAERLHSLGVRTIGDLQRWPLERMRATFGAGGEHWFELVRGIDDRPVVPDGEAKSLGQERTFETDLEEPEAARAALLSETEAVARRVRRHGLRARTVTVKLRYGDFETITRRATLPGATDATADLWGAASDLFDRWAQAHYRPIRLIGVAASGLTHEGRQLGLFSVASDERQHRLDRALDAIRDRFGPASIRRAGASDE